jgi:hypothetical protein
MIETEQQRRWWFATHPGFRNNERGGPKGLAERSPAPRRQTAAAMGFNPTWGQPFLPDPLEAARRLWEWLQANNPVMINDPNSEQMRKAAQWAAKAAEIAQQIAAGHAYGKHVVKQDEFPWIKSREELRDFIAGIMRKPTAWRPLENGRSAYWDGKTGTVVVRDPHHPDGGTAFRPPDGKVRYNRLK